MYKMNKLKYNNTQFNLIGKTEIFLSDSKKQMYAKF